MSPALKAVSLLTEPSGKPHYGGDRQFFKLMNILYSMLEVTNSYKGHQSRVSRTVLLSREGREDLIGYLAFNPRYEGDRETSLVDLWEENSGKEKSRENPCGGNGPGELVAGRGTHDAEARFARVTVRTRSERLWWSRLCCGLGALLRKLVLLYSSLWEILPSLPSWVRSSLSLLPKSTQFLHHGIYYSSPPHSPTPPGSVIHHSIPSHLLGAHQEWSNRKQRTWWWRNKWKISNTLSENQQKGSMPRCVEYTT